MDDQFTFKALVVRESVDGTFSRAIEEKQNRYPSRG